MADCLTQLQDVVNAQAENICNSIGVLQATAAPSPLFEPESSSINHSSEYYCELFASLITKTASVIDAQIDLIPSEYSSRDFQKELELLDLDYKETVLNSEEIILSGELLLEQISKVLHEITKSQLKLKN